MTRRTRSIRTSSSGILEGRHGADGCVASAGGTQGKGSLYGLHERTANVPEGAISDSGAATSGDRALRPGETVLDLGSGAGDLLGGETGWA